MGRLKNGLGKIPIAVAFVICGAGCLLVALALTKCTVSFAKRNILEIVSSYELDPTLTGFIYFDYTVRNESEQDQVQTTIGGEEGTKYSVLFDMDRQRVAFYAHMDEIAAVLWYTVCLAIAALVFYRWKIRKPYKVLMEAVGNISESNLDFSIDCTGQDELGRLCASFETMRQELVRNNQNMWAAVEERKRLNAAFAHDLRTPLTIMRGHAELIESELGKDENLEEIRDSIQEISGQISRLNSFADTMGRIQRLEDYEPRMQPVSTAELLDALRETAALIYPSGTVEVTSAISGKTISTDEEVLMQIFENIVSNAARHAREKIMVSLCAEEENVILTVQDDGSGFTKRDLDNALSAYYRGERTGEDTHFGLGLYISAILARKLDGDLALENAPEGGAKVSIKFKNVQKDLRGI